MLSYEECKAGSEKRQFSRSSESPRRHEHSVRCRACEPHSIEHLRGDSIGAEARLAEIADAADPYGMNDLSAARYHEVQEEAVEQLVALAEAEADRPQLPHSELDPGLAQELGLHAEHEVESDQALLDGAIDGALLGIGLIPGAGMASLLARAGVGAARAEKGVAATKALALGGESVRASVQGLQGGGAGGL